MILKLALAAGAAYVLDVYLRDRNAGYRARAIALAVKKPLIVVGSGTESSSATGPKLWGADIDGSVHCDAAAPRTSSCSTTSVCFCDVTDLSRFSDKQFGVALASNVLRYVPDRARAIRELHRIADVVIVSDHILPWPQIGAGPTLPLNGLDGFEAIDSRQADRYLYGSSQDTDPIVGLTHAAYASILYDQLLQFSPTDSLRRRYKLATRMQDKWSRMILKRFPHRIRD
jgi:hypothetical protein